jgi:hypothetical protein
MSIHQPRALIEVIDLVTDIRNCDVLLEWLRAITDKTVFVACQYHDPVPYFGDIEEGTLPVCPEGLSIGELSARSRALKSDAVVVQTPSGLMINDTAVAVLARMVVTVHISLHYENGALNPVVIFGTDRFAV